MNWAWKCIVGKKTPPTTSASIKILKNHQLPFPTQILALKALFNYWLIGSLYDRKVPSMPFDTLSRKFDSKCRVLITRKPEMKLFDGQKQSQLKNGQSRLFLGHIISTNTPFKSMLLGENYTFTFHFPMPIKCNGNCTGKIINRSAERKWNRVIKTSSGFVGSTSSEKGVVAFGTIFFGRSRRRCSQTMV